MRIAAIDSSGLVASVAILDDNIILAQYSVNYKKTHSQTLLPMLAEIVRMTEFDMETIDAIAVAKGPGSFTGLRIGSATVKGLGLALDKPIIEVPTLDALAYQLFGTECIICPLMDARRNQVYTGLYTFEQINGKSIFKVLEKQAALGIDEVIDKVNSFGKKVIYLGDGVPVYHQIIASNTKVPYEMAPAFLNRQNAASLATLAAVYYNEGIMVQAREHKPEYLRLSQAERERIEKKQAEDETAGLGANHD